MEIKIDGSISYIEVFCRCWRLVVSFSLDDVLVLIRYFYNSDVLRD